MNCLLSFTPMLIGLDQMSFVKGRQAPDDTRRIINLIRYAKHTGTPAVLLALDAEKDFDRVHWGYLSQIFLFLKIEPLAKLIRSDSLVHGIKIGEYKHRLGLFADDIILTLANPEVFFPEFRNY